MLGANKHTYVSRRSVLQQFMLSGSHCSWDEIMERTKYCFQMTQPSGNDSELSQINLLVNIYQISSDHQIYLSD